MSLTKKLLEPLDHFNVDSMREQHAEVEKRAQQAERFMFRICTNLSLAESNIGDKRDFYIAKAIKACKELQEWSTS